MFKQVTETIKKYCMLNYGDTVIVGVSGGADSVALLDVLYNLRDEYSLELHVVHVNHMLRGKDSDDDEFYVTKLCDKLNIKCHKFSFDVSEYAKTNSLTCEEAGRKLRYQAFEEVFNAVNANRIATAHHANDNCETVLHNILRGSGLTGLCGIHPVRGKFIRPLIEVSRADIEKYLSEKGILWCTDKTNAETVYTRNKIRLGLLPYLRKEFNSSADRAIERLSKLCREDDDFICITARQKLDEYTIEKNENEILVDRSKLCNEHCAIKRRLIRLVLEMLEIPLKDVHMVHIDNCIDFLESSVAGRCVSVGQCTVRIGQKGIHFLKEKTVFENYEYSLLIGEKVFIKEAGRYISCSVSEKYEPQNNKNTVFISGDNITEPLVIRNRRNGDRISPFGMQGSKKLKDYFSDKKISLQLRNVIPLIVYNDEVVWITGECLSERFKITSSTKKILKLTVEGF